MTTTRVAPPATLADATYTTSTRSGASGNCVEVAALPAGTAPSATAKTPPAHS